MDRNEQLDFENFVEKINNTINSFNREESPVHLPLHRYVRIHRGSRQNKYYYDKFTDGLHPNEELKQKWGCEILSVDRINTITINLQMAYTQMKN